MTLLLLKSCVKQEPNYEYKALEIDKMMEAMDVPTWLLNRMLKANHMKNEDWLEQLNILKVESDKLVAINHPDNFFQDEAERVADLIGDFIENLPAQKEERSLAWKKIKHSCEACHEVYE